MLLYPRLPSSVAAGLIRTHSMAELNNLRGMSTNQHDAVVYTPVGGTRVTKEQLTALRIMLVNISDQLGWPRPLTQTKGNEFDSLIGIALQRHMQIVPAEAAKDDVWTFIACVLVPDLVRWRFPGTSGMTNRERFLGGIRNTFQRLWWRSYVFYLPDNEIPYRLLKALGEDEQVQIMERPVLSGNRELARLIASNLLEEINRTNNKVPRMTLMREAAKRLVRKSSVVALDTLLPEELSFCVRKAFQDARSALLT